MVLYSDEFLKLRKDTPKKIESFFSLIQKLPLQIQMLVSNRMFYSSADLIPLSLTEESLKTMLFEL